MSVMMKCGHVSIGYLNNETKDPVCPICYGLRPEATIVAENQPNLDGRTAKCTYCKTTTESSLKLPFFHHYPKAETDSYYCGCRGWE